MRRSKTAGDGETSPVEGYQPGMDLFSDFNGLPEGANITDFYEHDANWSNRMILGDSLQVMASLAEREGLRGKVQCIYIDPPYGIKFNSNFQWSTTSRDVRDGNVDHITREPEQVKAFRDTWRDGIHSYLSYLRDRLEVARDLLADSGSVFVQIGDHENVHRVRAVLWMSLSARKFCLICEIPSRKQGAQKSTLLDFRWRLHSLWYAKNLAESSASKFSSLCRAPSSRKPAVDYFSRLELPDGRILTSQEKRFVGVLTSTSAFTKNEAKITFQSGRYLLQTVWSRLGANLVAERQVDPVSISRKDFHPVLRNRLESHYPLKGSVSTRHIVLNGASTGSCTV